MYGNPYYTPINRYQQMSNPIIQPTYTPQINSLLGKVVDGIDVVRAMDIPLDGSISYFPLSDNSAIVTKQLQSDGTSKTIIYKPVVEEQPQVKYLTLDSLKNLDLGDFGNLKHEFENIKTEIENLKTRIES